jgi:acyl carrier protein
VSLEHELKTVIIEALELEGVTADEIEDGAPIFVEGLGLDSIDALELAIAIDKKFGVRIKPDDEDTQKVFASVRSLATYLEGQMAKNAAAS